MERKKSKKDADRPYDTSNLQKICNPNFEK